MQPWIRHLIMFVLALLCIMHAGSTSADCFEIVVSRYAEDVSWLALPPFNWFQRVTVYDKNDRGGESAGNPPAHATIIRLPNVGREGHTILHHIVTRYDSLAEVTVFVVGSCGQNRRKLAKAAWVARQAAVTRDSAFPDVRLGAPLHQAFEDFQLGSYASTDAANARMNPESKLLPCPDRPFGVWARANRLPPARHASYNAIFAVSRAHIRRNPREFYTSLLRYVDHHSNPEAGHYLERAWLAVFHPVPAACLASTQNKSFE